MAKLRAIEKSINITKSKKHRLSKTIKLLIRIVSKDSIKRMEKYTLYGDNNFDIEKLAQALHYIVSKVGSEPNVGKTFLYKMLYFCDFDHFEKNQAFFIGERYRKIAHGPAPEHFDAAIRQLIRAGKIEVIKTKSGPYDRNKYTAIKEPTMDKLNANELFLIDNEIGRFRGMSATQISEYSYDDMPWKATEDNKYIDYRLAFYRTPIYSVEAGANGTVY